MPVPTSNPPPEVHELDLRGEISVLAKVDSPTPDPAIHQLLLATMGVGFIAGPYRYSMSASLGVDAGREVGLAYDISFLPFGIGKTFGLSSYLSLGTGIEFQGASGPVDDGVLFPVEACLELGDGDYHFMSRAHIAYVAGRTDDSPALGDHTELGGFVGVRFQPTHHRGPYGGIVYQEWFGARYAGLVVGMGFGAPIPPAQ